MRNITVEKAAEPMLGLSTTWLVKVDGHLAGWAEQEPVAHEIAADIRQMPRPFCPYPGCDFRGTEDEVDEHKASCWYGGPMEPIAIRPWRFAGADEVAAMSPTELAELRQRCTE